MDGGGEWVDEVSGETAADRQQAREGGGEGEARIQKGKGFWQGNPSTGPQPELAMTHPALPGSNQSFITSNKIALTHCLRSIFVWFHPPDPAQLLHNRSLPSLSDVLLFCPAPHYLSAQILTAGTTRRALRGRAK